jgi:predicted CxxxxCH...CXXCH cytochrome family protein
MYVFIALAGCAAPLDDPARFLDGGLASEVSCESDVESEILAARCGGSVCHSDGEQRAAGLDLVTPGVAERVANVAASSGCEGNMLAVPGDPGASLLYTKLLEAPPCGGRMPLAQDPLSDDDIDCVRGWIQEMTP